MNRFVLPYMSVVLYVLYSVHTVDSMSVGCTLEMLSGNKGAGCKDSETGRVQVTGSNNPSIQVYCFQEIPWYISNVPWYIINVPWYIDNVPWYIDNVPQYICLWEYNNNSSIMVKYTHVELRY